MFFFFFSSRRRHTRSLCDWSSDVCSFRSGVAVTRLRVAPFLGAEDGRLLLRLAQEDYSLRLPEVLQRSEERRVGKECRSRWPAQQQKKKIQIDGKALKT